MTSFHHYDTEQYHTHTDTHTNTHAQTQRISLLNPKAKTNQKVQIPDQMMLTILRNNETKKATLVMRRIHLIPECILCARSPTIQFHIRGESGSLVKHNIFGCQVYGIFVKNFTKKLNKGNPNVLTNFPTFSSLTVTNWGDVIS